MKHQMKYFEYSTYLLILVLTKTLYSFVHAACIYRKILVHLYSSWKVIFLPKFKIFIFVENLRWLNSNDIYFFPPLKTRRASKDIYIEVSPGTYSVTATSEDMVQQTHVVDVNAGQSVDLTFVLWCLLLLGNHRNKIRGCFNACNELCIAFSC